MYDAKIRKEETNTQIENWIETVLKGTQNYFCFKFYGYFGIKTYQQYKLS